MQLPVLQSQFLLNPAITYLNFGSFGACPKPIFDDYQHWQRELEFEPVQFITVNGLNYLQQSRQALSAYVHCDADDVVYTTNPSYGINIIAKSFPLSPGDEILSTNLEYGACDRTWSYYCKKAGAKYVRQPITLPVTSREAFVEDFFKGLSPYTRPFLSAISPAPPHLYYPSRRSATSLSKKDSSPSSTGLMPPAMSPWTSPTFGQIYTRGLPING